MRTAGTFTAAEKVEAAAPLQAQIQTREHPPWHSPVPYLFGGLAAMLGLIAFALLVLACSYWKLSGYLDSVGTEGDPEASTSAAADSKTDDSHKSPPAISFLVIMAGQEKPTFLATPASGRSSSFEKSSSCEGSEKKEKVVDLSEKPAEEIEGGGGSGGEGDDDDQEQNGDRSSP